MSSLIDKIRCKVVGIRDYLQHRMPVEPELIKELSQISKILSKDPSNEESFTREAEIYVYKNDNGLYIPSVHIKSAMIKAASNFRIGGKGKKTYKDFVKGFVLVDPEEILIEPQEYVLDRRWERVQRARVLRTRPKFVKGWKAEFDLITLDKTALPLSVLKDILKYAGRYVGIGDRRPEFGLFEVEFI